MLMLDLAVGLNLAFENLYLPFFSPYDVSKSRYLYYSHLSHTALAMSHFCYEGQPIIRKLALREVLETD